MVRRGIWSGSYGASHLILCAFYLFIEVISLDEPVPAALTSQLVLRIPSLCLQSAEITGDFHAYLAFYMASEDLILVLTLV